ncbi:MAG: DNA polymerase III subunit delta [Dysgonamonadaceae bacterium]|jgi:DNA polymerase-3 subunit delta'|nr:DNA polymerase III subunit delta [Dysgonamonadaceae bacterium]
MLFGNVIGQHEIKRQLTKSARSGNIPHARMITGNEGTGKLAIAIAYARYLCCTDRSEEDSCGRCPSCIKFNKLVHPDLHFAFPIIKNDKKKKETCDDYLKEWREFVLKNPYFNYNRWLDFIDAGNSQGLIYTRESETIVHRLNLRAYESEYKTVIIWLPEKMHELCANNLLKMIEEPPANTIFLLVSEAPDMVLPTIRSRTQHLHVPPIDKEAIGEELKKLAGAGGQTFDQTDIKRLIRLARGSRIRLEELLENTDSSRESLELFKSIMRSGWERNIQKMRTNSDKFAAMGRERQKKFLSYANNFIRENFFFKLNLPEINYLNKEEIEFAEKFSEYINENNVISLIDEFTTAEQHIESNVNPKTVFFDLSLKTAILIKIKINHGHRI